MDYLRFLARLEATDIHPAGSAASRALVEAAAVRRGQRLLEIGCGTGNTLARFARNGGLHIVGVDRMSEMLQVARRRLAAYRDCCSLVRADSAALPFADASFDRVYSESALGMQTTARVEKSLAESLRVLAPGGLFIANEAVWRPTADQAAVMDIARRSERDFGLRPATEKAWTVDDWVHAMRTAGFEPFAWAAIPARGRRDPLAAIAARLRIIIRLSSSRSLRRDFSAYRTKLLQHRHVATLLEARIFVARRPA